jgi:hypothetical protein
LSGLTPSEADVMARWDAGCDAQQIARETGLAVLRVKSIVSTYTDSAKERDFEGMIRAGSAALGQRIAAVAGVRL